MKIATKVQGVLWTWVCSAQRLTVSILGLIGVGHIRGSSMITRPLCVLAILLNLLILTPGIVSAQEPVEVTLKPQAIAINGGQILLMSAKVTCDPVGDVLEALVTVEQEGVFGEGFFSAIECDGKQHKSLVRVQAFDGGFTRGEANASAFILICDAQDNCVDGQSSRIIRIRESKRMQ